MKTNLEELQKYKISKDMLYQLINDLYSKDIPLDKDNMDIKVTINGFEVENPLRLIERLDNSIDICIKNAEKVIDEKAKKFLKEKYEDLEDEANQLVRKIYDLQESIGSRIHWD